MTISERDTIPHNFDLLNRKHEFWLPFIPNENSNSRNKPSTLLATSGSESKKQLFFSFLSSSSATSSSSSSSFFSSTTTASSSSSETSSVSSTSSSSSSSFLFSPCYSRLSLSMYPPLTCTLTTIPSPLPLRSAHLTHFLIREIAEYRKQKLFIPSTFWHRPLSIALHSQLDRIELSWSQRNQGQPGEQQQQQQQQQSQSHPSQQMQIQPQPAGLANILLIPPPSNNKAIASSAAPASAALLPLELDQGYDVLDENLLPFVPDHHIWFGRPLHFTSSHHHDILAQLRWTGMLDYSIPNVLYALACKIFPYAWGLESVWVYLGYLYNVEDIRIS